MKIKILNALIQLSLFLQEMGYKLYVWAYMKTPDYYTDLFIYDIPYEHLDDEQKKWLEEQHGWGKSQYMWHHRNVHELVTTESND